jgi:hypothetical protein
MGWSVARDTVKNGPADYLLFFSRRIFTSESESLKIRFTRNNDMSSSRRASKELPRAQPGNARVAFLRFLSKDRPPSLLPHSCPLLEASLGHREETSVGHLFHRQQALPRA